MDKIYTFSDLENIQSFVTSLKRKSNKLGVKLELTNNTEIVISEKIKCSGFFQSKFGKDPNLLTTATKLPIERWLSVLVHESCHMDQWEEKIKLWKDHDKLNDNVVDEWLEGKNHSVKKVELAIKVTRDLELDCEQRAVNKIKKFNLPINVKEYIQKANVYIFFHNWVLVKRKWYNPTNCPFTNPKIYKLLKHEWYDSYETIPPDLLKAFKKYKI